jgi:hypothetical protein
MKKNHSLYLTEEQVKELLGECGEQKQEKKETVTIRNENLLNHFRFSLFALTGTHN